MARTPGPWKSKECIRGLHGFSDWRVYDIVGPENESLAIVGMNGTYQNNPGYDNARLIAAAPLMKLFVDIASDGGDNTATLIKEAIDGKRDMSDVWNIVQEKATKA